MTAAEDRGQRHGQADGQGDVDGAVGGHAAPPSPAVAGSKAK
jgi:hypothetical protein